MRKFTCDPEAEISGAALLGNSESLQSSEMDALAAEFGLRDLRDDEWYSLQNALNFWNELSTRPNLMSNLVATGMAVAKTALVPSELTDAAFEEWVKGWDSHYQANFRNADVGTRTVIQVSPNHYKIVLDGTVMPDDLEYGVLYGFAKELLPQDVDFNVWYDEDELRMDLGGDRTILHVEWA